MHSKIRLRNFFASDPVKLCQEEEGYGTDPKQRVGDDNEKLRENMGHAILVLGKAMVGKKPVCCGRVFGQNQEHMCLFKENQNMVVDRLSGIVFLLNFLKKKHMSFFRARKDHKNTVVSWF